MKTYKSRVDGWMRVALGIPPAGALFAIAAGIAKSQPTSIYIGVGALVFYGAVLFGLVLPIQYAIDAEGLRVRAGIQKLFVPWARLLKAELSSNPLSSPALSLRRINVEYRKPNGRETFVLVSPPDREQFLADLADASPEHRLDGGTVVRT